MFYWRCTYFNQWPKTTLESGMSNIDPELKRSRNVNIFCSNHLKDFILDRADATKVQLTLINFGRFYWRHTYFRQGPKTTPEIMKIPFLSRTEIWGMLQRIMNKTKSFFTVDLLYVASTLHFSYFQVSSTFPASTAISKVLGQNCSFCSPEWFWAIDKSRFAFSKTSQSFSRLTTPWWHLLYLIWSLLDH